MSRIDGWRCYLPGYSAQTGKKYPMVRVDEQTEAQYAMYGEIDELKTFIYHDGSLAGKNTAMAIARSLAESGRAVRKLPTPGIIAIYEAPCHEIVELRTLRSVAKQEAVIKQLLGEQEC